MGIYSEKRTSSRGCIETDNALIQEEIALHKKAQDEAKRAADQQLLAIHGLTKSIETLNATLASIKVGAQGAAQAISGLAKSAQDLAAIPDVTINFDVSKARAGLKAVLDGVAQVTKESQTPEELQLSVANARESIAVLREQFLAYSRDVNTPIAAQETVGKSLGQLTDLDRSVTAAGESKDPKQALAGVEGQLSAVNGYINEVESSIKSLPKAVAPAVEVDPAPAVKATNEIQDSIDGIKGKEVEVVVKAKVVKEGDSYSNVPDQVDNVDTAPSSGSVGNTGSAYVRKGNSFSAASGQGGVPDSGGDNFSTVPKKTQKFVRKGNSFSQYAEGGLVSAKVSNNEYQMPPETVKAVGTDYLSSLGEISQPGLIKGPGNGTSDSIPRVIPENSFIVPAKVVDKLGVPFLDKIRQGQKPIHRATGGIVSNSFMADIRKMKFDPSIVAQVPPIDLKIPALPQAKSTPALQPITFNLGDASITAQAPAGPVADFQAALRLQALKTGRKVV